jgi:benzylsuccinate CoA-transferase BbsF subunit
LTALSGFYTITGWPDREPVGPSGPYPDYIASRLGTLSILAALDYRRKTGKGQYIDLSQFEGAVHFLSPLILDNSVNNRVAPASGNLSPDFAPHNAYHCHGLDRWCAIAVTSEDKWHSLCKIIGNPEWARDPKFTTMSARKNNEAELDKLIENWTMQHSAEEIMSMMQSAGVGAGVVNSARDLLENDPQIKHRNLFQRVQHPEISEYSVPGFSYRFSDIDTQLQRAPLLGEHNEYVCKKILGMSDEEVAQLVINGVIE